MAKKCSPHSVLEEKQTMNIILLSGGSGKRLWPLSNDIRSKQFIKIFKKEDGAYESMLQRVYRQIKQVDTDATVTIATSKTQVSAIHNQLGEHVGVSIEPCRRDTFPAIALATAYLVDVLHIDPSESVVVCPVDPYVEDAYFEALKKLSAQADKGVRTLAAVRIFTSGKYHSLLGNFPSRIASNAENSPISQRGCTSLDSPKPTAEAVQENNQPLFHKLKKKGKPYMGFVVLHMEKAHGSDSGTTAHIERFIIPKNADPTRTHLNRKLIDYPDGVKDRTAAIQHRLENAGLTRKIGNNQVQAIRIIVSGTHEDMERIEKEGRLDEWCADNMSYFAFMFGKENIVAAHLHRDEETPHIHITLVPIVKGERKRRKREEQTKKRYRKKPTDTVRLCADDIMTRLKLKTYQDTYAIAMAKYGLQRGIDGSTARHKSTQQYYRDTQKLVDSLKAEVVDLQERKEAARQELRQAKKEVQTEKLKGAATTAATNIAESVGSFFGSNKVKTLERENKNLHERVSELQEEARQREQQQAKHIQEITDAYELRHRKLSEFTDFVKRYFPYVEKLIPTINFLRERLGFNDDIIRRLCTFKDVPIKGKLHSSEFNQGFETQRAVCSIKEDENGKFDFKIDGVSHISWFRKKMNEFREAIGIPKPRQNRGMQL